MMGAIGFGALISWGLGLLIFYFVIYYAVKNAIRDSAVLHEIRDQLNNITFHKANESFKRNDDNGF